MFSEMEDYFRVHLSMDHLFNWQGLDEDFVIYPFAIRYLAQYLHWWEHESRKPSAKSLSPHLLLTEVRKLSSTNLLQAIGNQAIVREYLVGILRRTEQFSYRHYSNIEINRAWSDVLRRSLQLDEQDMALSLSTVLEHDFEGSMQEVIGMQSTDLHNFMDVLQSLIDRQYGSIRVLERFLQKLVDKTGVLPKHLFLSGIKRIGENPIAGGGFADVWKGKSGERTVALKVIRIFGLANPNESQHQEFCKEAMIWRQFRHQNILPFYGVCIDEFSPRLALVSPWMRNGDVLSYLKENDGVNHIAVIAGIALGLLYLHTLKPLVIHGDLRGANVLIDDRGRPKLADFGLARIVDSQASTVAATSFNGKGAVRWQAPELLDSGRFGSDYCRVSPRSDVYAFAVVCLEVFTKEIPFAHLRDIQVISEVVIRDRRPSRPAADSLAVQCGLSDKIWSLIERCWTAQPWDRPDMQTVVQDLTVDFP
ncbi:kinase-like protein [Fomitiporia mediterranea MF3/22]|uniref:kinase-like protein n=1 Tax=Fomitiporia mediterranea (strain MF3/22) TaxID=694068 RepID=UPI0004409380|nr:kinase-like protein [Fomitiporia mediterranea MF3/22]EJD00249.1 kinase-like protein [Fomitiporia mediterranea MF3/22]